MPLFFLTVSWDDPGVIVGIIGVIFGIVGAIAGIICAIYAAASHRESLFKTKELNKLNGSLEVQENFTEVWTKITGIMDNEVAHEKHISLKNIGLDLEKMLPDLGNYIESKTKQGKRPHLSYCGLIINPESDLIKPLINERSNITTAFVNSSYATLKILKEEYKQNGWMDFDVRSYDVPPLVHGIMINERHLFLGFTEIKAGKLHGSNNPYIYLNSDSKTDATVHYFRFYKTWFDYYWNHGKR